MVSGISKRQQLRNERALQDLIRSVPGNDRCADCSAMNPGMINSIAAYCALADRLSRFNRMGQLECMYSIDPESDRPNKVANAGGYR